VSKGQIVVCELPFLPCTEYFALWQQFDSVIFDVHEHYVKQSYRNRCVILGAHGPITLTIPIRHTAPKIPFCEVLVDNDVNWQRPFWKSIVSAYGKSPYFEYFENEFRETMNRPVEKLVDYNLALLTLCLKCAGVSVKFSLSEKYLMHKDFDFTDFRSKISPKRAYSDRGLLEPKPYTQNFGSEFVPNLSVLDLIFCEGPYAYNTLRKSPV